MTFISDCFVNTISAIRVGYLSGSKQIIIPTTKYTRNIILKLEQIGVISHFIPYKIKSTQQYWQIYLNYYDNQPGIRNIKLISTRSKKYYIKLNSLIDICKTRKGVLLISTTYGILTNFEARTFGTGGLLILWVEY